MWREDSVTTKLRVVFDASCRTTSGASLNESLLKGPCIQEELINLLTRFRTHKYAMTADVSKMYRQIWVSPKHRDYQRIFWRSDINQEVETFQLNTVTYGTVPASFLATGCMQRLADEEAENFPKACAAIKHDFYMDDFLGGAESLQEALHLRNEIIEVMKRGGFELRKWTASDPNLLSDLKKEHDDPTLVLNLDENSPKILGLRWDPVGDIFKYKVNLPERSAVTTKRRVLSEIATIFDPLGLIGPVVIKAKIKMQRLWIMGIGWDESLPEKPDADWQIFRESLMLLNKLIVPRCIMIRDEISELQIHGFLDASMEAFGACLYMVATNTQGERISRLICAKSRVAPLKTLSLPRLELCGAVLLARLVAKIVPKLRLPGIRRILWTDSSIVLAWISSPSASLKTFVAHRVGEIQDLTSISEWSHVPTKANPADLISRGLEANQILNEVLWWEGPAWLRLHQSSWPSHSVKRNLETEEERRVISLTIVKQNKLECLYRYSSFNKLLRVISWCWRFIHNSMHRQGNRLGPLQPEDLEQATRFVIKAVQKECWPKEILNLKKCGEVNSKSNIFRLRPFLDSNGILRVGGRLKNASDLSSFQKNPMLLPPNNHVTYLILQNAHESLLHCTVVHN